MGLPKGWSGLKTQFSIQHAARRPTALHGLRGFKAFCNRCTLAPQACRMQAQVPKSARFWQGGFRLCRFAALPHARKQNTRALCRQIAFLLLRASSNLIWTQALSGSSPCCPALPVSFDSPDRSTQAANLAVKSGLFHSRINKPSSALPPVFPQ